MLENVIVRGHFGKALRARRERLSYNQWDIAAVAGVKQSTIHKWETSEKPPKNPVGLLNLAAFFKVPLEDFMAGAIPATWLGIDAIEAPGERLPAAELGEPQEDEAIRVIERKRGWQEGELTALLAMFEGAEPGARSRMVSGIYGFLEGYRAQQSGNTNNHKKEHVNG